VTYDRRVATTLQMKNLAKEYLKSEGYSRKQVDAWAEDMAKALATALSRARKEIDAVKQDIEREEEEDERRGGAGSNSRYAGER